MSSTAAPKTITELKVSAHLMTLDAGLFCVFNSPGAPLPDAATGLPGVRLSMAPAPGGLHGDVSISGFNAGGWLSGVDGAALVRVTGGPAQVLVTVYQDLAGQRDAPKLQVIRLTETAAEELAAPGLPPEAEPAPANTAAASVSDRNIEVAAHIYGRGDVGGVLGDWMGDRGSKRWIEGFGLMPGEGIAVSDIEYQAVLGRNWQSPWSEGGQFCGSRGMSLPILGLRVRLRGAAAKTHTLSISATFVDGTEVGPITDGEVCEAPSLSPLEAFKVMLSPRDAVQDAAPATGTRAPSATTPVRGRGRAVTPSAPTRKATRQEARPVLEQPASKKATGKPGRKATPAAAVTPPAPATPPKPPAKRTPATTRRR